MMNLENEFTLVVQSTVHEHRNRKLYDHIADRYRVYYFTAFAGQLIARLGQRVTSIAVAWINMALSLTYRH